MFFGKKVTGPAEWLLVCLGNYGKQYENTRHNIGFMAAERLIDKQGLRCNRLRFRALTELIEFGGARVLLLPAVEYLTCPTPILPLSFSSFSGLKTSLTSPISLYERTFPLGPSVSLTAIPQLSCPLC